RPDDLISTCAAGHTSPARHGPARAARDRRGRDRGLVEPRQRGTGPRPGLPRRRAGGPQPQRRAARALRRRPGPPARRHAGPPLPGVLLLTVAAAALIGWRLLGPGALTGGALPRLDVTAGQVLDRILSLRDDAGLGSRAPADPLLSVLLVWSLPFLGSLDTAV